jgi:transposase
MRRAKLEGRQIGRSRLDINRDQVVLDRRSGLSLTQIAKKHGISRASVCRLVKEAKGDQESLVPKFALKLPARANAASSAQ